MKAATYIQGSLRIESSSDVEVALCVAATAIMAHLEMWCHSRHVIVGCQELPLLIKLTPGLGG